MADSWVLPVRRGAARSSGSARFLRDSSDTRARSLHSNRKRVEPPM
ncbi:hypothetical protein CU044_5187 [Streptomyces sp. L-9-10]|nr:hypothetical protein CU044_5187 [Streptomyces sp. L-9-10]